MIIVTGGAGFIGSNFVHALGQRWSENIMVVDDLADGRKIHNMSDCTIHDYLDKDDFLSRIKEGQDFGTLTGVFHFGACSDTTEWDGRFMMRNNYDYSKELLQYCLQREIPFQYASSASVYGTNTNFKEDIRNEHPINPYAYSKFLFDQTVRACLPQAKSQVAGFRYFNVYGPREQHKDSMASVASHFFQQVSDAGRVRLFEGSGGFDNGEQRRDFIYVDDVVDVNLWFLDHPGASGIFNVGTGKSQSFNDVASAAIQWHGSGEIEYIPFPEHLKGSYQSFTEADITLLRDAGYQAEFKTVEQGVPLYLDWLSKQSTDPE